MISVGKIIKRFRAQKGLIQKEFAAEVDMRASNFTKIESGRDDVSEEALANIAQFFTMTIDEIGHFEDVKTPASVKVQGKKANEKVPLIASLDIEDKNAVYRIIDGMLTKNKFQIFF